MRYLASLRYGAPITGIYLREREGGEKVCGALYLEWYILERESELPEGPEREDSQNNTPEDDGCLWQGNREYVPPA